MGTYRKKAVLLLTVILFFGCSGISLSAEGDLPEGSVIEQAFKPGKGLPVGTVQLVRGEVVIIHRGEKQGYLAQKALPLFKGDTLITRLTGSINLDLNDGSIVTLGPESRMLINESVYDQKKKSRFSFLSMGWGKARFWVKKFMDFKRSEFKIRTQTAIVGVRGSDFGVKSTQTTTQVVAFENTRLHLISLAEPDIQPTLLKDFERVVVQLGKRPSEIERLSPAEITRLKQDFTFFPKIDRPEKKPLESKRRKKPQKGVVPVPAKTAETTVSEQAGIVVSEEELVEPVQPEEIGVMAEVDTAGLLTKEDMTQMEKQVLDQQEEVQQEIQEEIQEYIREETQEEFYLETAEEPVEENTTTGSVTIGW